MDKYGLKNESYIILFRTKLFHFIASLNVLCLLANMTTSGFNITTPILGLFQVFLSTVVVVYINTIKTTFYFYRDLYQAFKQVNKEKLLINTASLLLLLNMQFENTSYYLIFVFIVFIKTRLLNL